AGHPAVAYGRLRVPADARGHGQPASALRRTGDRHVAGPAQAVRGQGRLRVLQQRPGRCGRGRRRGHGAAGRTDRGTPSRPMLATPGGLPIHDAAYAYEPKWDGVRAIAYIRDGGLRLFTRNDADVTPAYPELAGLGEALGPVPAVLDGEVVAFDGRGRVSF